jgi:hypothetical protein
MPVFYIPDVKQNFSKNENMLSIYSRQFLLSSPLAQKNERNRKQGVEGFRKKRGESL